MKLSFVNVGIAYQINFFFVILKTTYQWRNFQQASKRSAPQEAGGVSQCTNPSPRCWGFTQIPRPRELLRGALLELQSREDLVAATDGHHAEHDDRPVDEFGDHWQLTQSEISDQHGDRRHQIEQRRGGRDRESRHGEAPQRKSDRRGQNASIDGAEPGGSTRAGQLVPAERQEG